MNKRKMPKYIGFAKPPKVNPKEKIIELKPEVVNPDENILAKMMKHPEQCPEVVKAKISPIIFTHKGNCVNPMLHDYPFEFSYGCNNMILESNMMMDDLEKIYEKTNYRTARFFDRLQSANNTIMTNQSIDYLIQNTIFGFSNLIDGSYLGRCENLFDRFPIKAFVEEGLRKDLNIRNLFYDIISQYNLYSITNKNSYYGTEEEIKEYINFSITHQNIVAIQMAQHICNIICFETDRAINEVLLNIHPSPIYDMVLSDLCKYEPGLREFRKSPEFNIYCAVYLKNYLRNLISDFMVGTIGPSCSYLVANLFKTQFNIFAPFCHNENLDRKLDFDNDDYDDDNPE